MEVAVVFRLCKIKTLLLLLHICLGSAVGSGTGRQEVVALKSGASQKLNALLDAKFVLKYFLFSFAPVLQMSLHTPGLSECKGQSLMNFKAA